MPVSGAVADPAHADTQRADGLVDGRYRLGEVLGTGGAAVVRRAVDERLGRDVALKLFHPGVTEPERQTGELRIMAGLAHPALVRMYDGGTCTDANGAQFTYLALEFVDGPTLRAALAGGPLPPADVARIGADLAAALDHLHGKGIVHRDVKPANVLLPHAADVRAKLADFGVARLLDGTRVTATGATVGTANYLSPEQVRGEHVGTPSDMWSLGLVLLEALAGAMEYAGSGVAAATARLTRPPSIPPWLGPPWSTLLGRMLAADPSARPSAREVADALADVSAARGSEADVTAVLPLVVEPGTSVLVERRRAGAGVVWWSLAAACALAMLTVLIVSVAGTHDAPAEPVTPISGTSGTVPAGAPPAPTTGPGGSAAARHRSTAPGPSTSAATPGKGHDNGKGDGKGKDKGHGNGNGNDDGGDSG